MTGGTTERRRLRAATPGPAAAARPPERPLLREQAHAAAEAVRMPQPRAWMEPLPINPVGDTPEEFAAHVARENGEWRGSSASGRRQAGAQMPA